MKPMYLRTLRERRELTQEQLAEKAHVAQKTISKLETHPGAKPASDTLLNLAAALDVDPRALRFGPDPRREAMAS